MENSSSPTENLETSNQNSLNFNNSLDSPNKLIKEILNTNFSDSI